MSAQVHSLELHRISRDFRGVSDEAIETELRQLEGRIEALGQRALALSMESLRRQGLLSEYEVWQEVTL